MLVDGDSILPGPVASTPTTIGWGAFARPVA